MLGIRGNTVLTSVDADWKVDFGANPNLILDEFMDNIVCLCSFPGIYTLALDSYHPRRIAFLL
jgi:hypothetical protein